MNETKPKAAIDFSKLALPAAGLPGVMQNNASDQVDM
jgi:hypothetical protein